MLVRSHSSILLSALVVAALSGCEGDEGQGPHPDAEPPDRVAERAEPSPSPAAAATKTEPQKQPDGVPFPIPDPLPAASQPRAIADAPTGSAAMLGAP
jgi:hypothetical protein